MPSLMAIISANADPMRRELAAVQRMSAQTGATMQANLSGGHVKSGAIREVLVLMREVSRGNWTRVPGSFALLLQQLGALNLLSGGGANAAKILADAWEKQAAAASLAAVAAVRKASASAAAFAADEAETEATLEQAVADEEGAAAAIMNAKATQAKAVAAAEAAASTEASAAVSLGALAAGLAVVAVVALTVYETFWGLKNAMKGMEMPILKNDYIPKALRHVNSMAEAQKEVTREVLKTTEAYNSATAAAKRIATIHKEQFEHARKMNEFEKNPALKAARELAIDQAERHAEIADKVSEKVNLEQEARDKMAAAGNIHVATAAEDAQRKQQLQQNAEAAEAFLKPSTWNEYKKQLAAAFGPTNLLGYSARMKQIEAAGVTNEAGARGAIRARDEFADKEQANKEQRDRKELLVKASAAAAAEAAKIGLELPGMTSMEAQKNKDDSEYQAKKLASETKTHANSLQEVGLGLYHNSSMIDRVARATEESAACLKDIADYSKRHPGKVTWQDSNTKF